MTTNAVRLQPLIKDLRSAGLDRLNISLDSLDPEIAKEMAGVTVDPQKIWTAALAAKDAGMPVKINAVIKRGANESQILPLALASRDAGFTLRYIEYMDVGTKNDWTFDKVVSCSEILDTLSSEFDLSPIAPKYHGEVATRYLDSRSGAEFGFINSISKPFCSACNRTRISADGQFYTCLFAAKGTNLKAWLRDEEIDDDTLLHRLTQLWSHRNDRYSEERTTHDPKSTKPEMWAIGG
jgi:cyclic pyranopterin phosphate synthase